VLGYYGRGNYQIRLRGGRNVLSFSVARRDVFAPSVVRNALRVLYALETGSAACPADALDPCRGTMLRLSHSGRRGRQSVSNHLTIARVGKSGASRRFTGRNCGFLARSGWSGQNSVPRRIARSGHDVADGHDVVEVTRAPGAVWTGGKATFGGGRPTARRLRR
jgi:hypothetical protein